MAEPSQLGGALSVRAFLRSGLVVLAVVGAAACAGVTGRSLNNSDGGSAVLEAEPASISFGNVAEGSTAKQGVSIVNNGTASTTVTKITATGTGFSIQGITLPQELAAGTSVKFVAAFAPKSTGAASGSISIASNDSDSPMIVSMKGTGATDVLTATPSSATFSGVVVGVSASQTMQLEAAGEVNIQVTGVTTSGTGFSVSGLSTPLTLSPGKGVTFTALFKPTSTGSKSGTISITSTASGSPLKIGLSGTAVNPTVGLVVSPASITFSGLSVGKSASQDITLKNTGNVNVTVSSIKITGSGFSITSGGGTNIVLTPGQQHTLIVTFLPVQAGNATGALTVSSNATGSPAKISLTGSTVSSSTASQHTVTLNWDASTSASVIGYYIYRSTTSGQFTKLNSTAESQTTYEDTNVAGGLTYNYVVTAVDSAQIESMTSNQVSVTIPNN